MKKIITVCFLLVPLLARAGENFALNFTGIPLVQFAAATYKQMLHRDYVISSELLAADKPISISVRSIAASDLPRLIETILGNQGVTSVSRDGVYYLGLADSAAPGQSAAGRSVFTSASLGRDSSSADIVVLPSAPPGSTVLRDSQQAYPAGYVSEVFKPRNRKADFITTALNAVFLTKPATSAGSVVVVTGTKENVERFLKVASALDEVAHKVKLSATFVEVSTNNSSGLGVSVIADVLGAKLGVKLGDTSNGSFTLRTNRFQAVIDAISSDGRFKQVAAPTAIVDDYEHSNLSFGDSVPTIGSTTLDKNGNPVSQVTYQQSGVLLNVTPSVLGSGKINVVVDGQVSSFSATTTGVSGSPTLSKRQVQTTVTVDDGELLIIGGLNSNKATESESGFSFLPKSWSVRNDALTSTDLVLILSAAVVQ